MHPDLACANICTMWINHSFWGLASCVQMYADVDMCTWCRQSTRTQIYCYPVCLRRQTERWRLPRHLLWSSLSAPLCRVPLVCLWWTTGIAFGYGVRVPATFNNVSGFFFPPQQVPYGVAPGLSMERICQAGPCVCEMMKRPMLLDLGGAPMT
jgi:hypothetical protein